MVFNAVYLLVKSIFNFQWVGYSLTFLFIAFQDSDTLISFTYYLQ